MCVCVDVVRPLLCTIIFHSLIRDFNSCGNKAGLLSESQYVGSPWLASSPRS